MPVQPSNRVLQHEHMHLLYSISKLQRCIQFGYGAWKGNTIYHSICGDNINGAVIKEGEKFFGFTLSLPWREMLGISIVWGPKNHKELLKNRFHHFHGSRPLFLLTSPCNAFSCHWESFWRNKMYLAQFWVKVQWG